MEIKTFTTWTNMFVCIFHTRIFHADFVQVNNMFCQKRFPSFFRWDDLEQCISSFKLHPVSCLSNIWSVISQGYSDFETSGTININITFNGLKLVQRFEAISRPVDSRNMGLSVLPTQSCYRLIYYTSRKWQVATRIL